MTTWTTPTLTEVRSLRPVDLAKRWQCSERHVRDLVRTGNLPSFRIGGKLIRIPLDVIEEIERCSLHSELFSTVVGFTLPGVKTASAAVVPCVPKIVQLPSKR